MANGLVNELREVKPRSAAELPARDVRARKAPLRSALIRFDTLRKLSRVLTLGTLDVAGVFLAIFTALELKVLLRTHYDLPLAWDQTKDVAPLACLVTVLL